MKLAPLSFAIALAVASLGIPGLALAQPATDAPTATADATRTAPSERPRHHRRHAFHRGHDLHHGIARMDADGDGRVSRAEFDAARTGREAARQARGGKEPGARREAATFDAIDANGDGHLVRSEVLAHREQRLREMRERREQRMADAFAAADLNGDGRLSRVEVDEKMPRLSARFAWMDDDRDGFLDLAELRAGRPR
ncbi:MAG: hypothetical protein GX856_09860 [Gammaproteobacteria bacterium]|nr:hypothetical protein [Gammaproteobacteria bacterium]